MNLLWFLRVRRLRWLLAILLLGSTAVIVLGPLVVTVLWSLIDPATGWFPPHLVPPRLSLHFWRKNLATGTIGDSTLLSFAVAALATLVCAGLALPTGYALARRPRRWHWIAEFLILAPIAVPGVAVASGLGALFIRWHMAYTVIGLALAHAVVLLPFMVRVVTATYQSIPQDLLDAASNLGASPAQLTVQVLIPLLMPGLFAGGVFTFIGSFQEFVLSFIIGAPRLTTLPVRLWAVVGAQAPIFPDAAVLSIMVLIPIFLLLLLVESFLKQEYLAAGFGKL
ncbi:MAG: ABC transporter permease subunit [Deinococcus sp.]|nr:ABC transporter permease subunit [Deinococcus sp.]